MASMTSAQVSAFRESLLAWFDQHKRDLPWRRTRDPYPVWVSEIMLQQTRVAAALDHYARWMARFPTVAALAEAKEPEVLALWSGLGYYRRARFLHAGAKAVERDHAGVLPGSAIALRTLPGIGEYTSAAIASIAFYEPVAVVDGNVERVIMRLCGLSLKQPGTMNGAGVSESAGSIPSRSLNDPPNSRTLAAAPLAREIRRLAESLLAPDRPGDFNQSVMELGATVCLPRAPLCLHCPVHHWCATRGEHIGSPPQAMQTRSIAYALAERERHGNQEVLLAQRPSDASLMPGMWELPELASTEHCGDGAEPLLTLRHSITVTNYTVQIFASTAHPPPNTPARWTPISQLPDTALTGLARKALKRLTLWPQPISSPPQS